MVKLKLKVGPKGQIIIPKPLREAYNIKEGDSVIIEPREDGILIRKVMKTDELLQWLKDRRRKLGAKIGKLGETAKFSVETEFEEE